LVERIEFDLLFRWFVDLGVDDPVWDATTFTKNRDRLLQGDVASEFIAWHGPQWRAKLPRPEAQQRDPRLNHRPRCKALSQGTRQGSQTGQR